MLKINNIKRGGSEERERDRGEKKAGGKETSRLKLIDKITGWFLKKTNFNNTLCKIYHNKIENLH